MADKLQIVNRGLQRIGAKRLASLAENSRERAAVDACYDLLVEQELMANFWTFAIRRTELTANPTAPAFGRANAFDLPADFLRKAPDDPTHNTFPKDYLIEGGQLLTNFGGALQLRYVSSNVTETDFHPLFANALSMRIGMELAEELTQSATKLEKLEQAYLFFVREARRINAIESGPTAPEEDELVLVRLTQGSTRALRPYS